MVLPGQRVAGAASCRFRARLASGVVEFFAGHDESDPAAWPSTNPCLNSRTCSRTRWRRPSRDLSLSFSILDGEATKGRLEPTVGIWWYERSRPLLIET